jgi:hypothetical protein
MTSDQYVELVVNKYTVDNAVGSPAHQAAMALIPSLKKWAGQYLLEISFSGSYAKGTAISLGTDVDLFISVDHIPDMGMKDIYWNLYNFLEGRQFQPQPRNVAIGVKSHGLWVDLVPGRKQQGATTDHSLYRRKADTWTQTNVGQHVKLVAESGRTAEIRALKIWRQQQRLEFPSFYLELTALAALKGRRLGQLGENVMGVLRYLGDGFEDAVVVDPANSNNLVSDDLATGEKRTIVTAARKSLAMQKWEHILW